MSIITNEMKARFIGEFYWEEDAPYYDEDGELHEHTAEHVVPWNLVKRIHKEMTAFAAPAPSAPAQQVPECVGQLIEDIRGLIEESEGVAGLHLNGEVAPWDDLLPGGRFERISSLEEAEALYWTKPLAPAEVEDIDQTALDLTETVWVISAQHYRPAMQRKAEVQEVLVEFLQARAQLGAVPADMLPWRWIDGAPSGHYALEWFLAETDSRERVVLTALPEEYAYDFKTADDTYIKRDRIKRWAQFPDSQFTAAALTATGGRDDVAVDEAIRYLHSQRLYSLLTDIQNGIDSPATAGVANSLIVGLDRIHAALAAAQPAQGESE